MIINLNRLKLINKLTESEYEEINKKILELKEEKESLHKREMECIKKMDIMIMPFRILLSSIILIMGIILFLFLFFLHYYYKNRLQYGYQEAAFSYFLLFVSIFIEVVLLYWLYYRLKNINNKDNEYKLKENKLFLYIFYNIFKDIKKEKLNYLYEEKEKKYLELKEEIEFFNKFNLIENRKIEDEIWMHKLDKGVSLVFFEKDLGFENRILDIEFIIKEVKKSKDSFNYFNFKEKSLSLCEEDYNYWLEEIGFLLKVNYQKKQIKEDV